MNSELLIPLRLALARLTPGERRLVMIGVALVSAALLYLILWLPVKRQLANLRVSVPQERVQLQRMRTQAAAIQPLRARRANPPPTGNLLSVVEQTATARGLRSFIKRMEADGSNGVQLILDAVAFNALLAWLADLQESHALLIESASVDAQTSPGTVNAKLTLRIETP